MPGPASRGGGRRGARGSCCLGLATPGGLRRGVAGDDDAAGVTHADVLGPLAARAAVGDGDHLGPTHPDPDLGLEHLLVMGVDDGRDLEGMDASWHGRLRDVVVSLSYFASAAMGGFITGGMGAPGASPAAAAARSVCAPSAACAGAIGPAMTTEGSMSPSRASSWSTFTMSMCGAPSHMARYFIRSARRIVLLYSIGS